MLNLNPHKIKMGMEAAHNSNASCFVYQNLISDNPTWQNFIDHLSSEIHTPLDNPLVSDTPFKERVINGVMMKSMFYMDVRVRNLSQFSEASDLMSAFSEATGDDIYPVSVFINFVGNEYDVPAHSDNRETIFWQCIGRTVWHVYPDGSEFPMTYELNPGDVIYIPKGIRHAVDIFEPRASIAFGYKNET